MTHSCEDHRAEAREFGELAVAAYVQQAAATVEGALIDGGWNPDAPCIEALTFLVERAERADSLRDVLERLVADLETHSAQGAPLYAHNALAAGSEGERDLTSAWGFVCAACGGKWDDQTTSCEECGGQTATVKGE